MNIAHWWNDHKEIDLVVLGEADAMLVESKWTNKPVGSDILANLERKASLVQSGLKERLVRYGRCSRSGFTGQLIEDMLHGQDVTLFDLPAMMG